MPIFTPPTVSYAWPTRDRLTSRLKVPRGIAVLTDGAGGWIENEFPYLGDLLDLVDGVDYFLGGHRYFISSALAASLRAAGYTVIDTSNYPQEFRFPSTTLYPEA